MDEVVLCSSVIVLVSVLVSVEGSEDDRLRSGSSKRAPPPSPSLSPPPLSVVGLAEAVTAAIVGRAAVVGVCICVRGVCAEVARRLGGTLGMK